MVIQIKLLVVDTDCEISLTICAVSTDCKRGNRSVYGPLLSETVCQSIGSVQTVRRVVGPYTTPLLRSVRTVQTNKPFHPHTK